MVVHFCFVFLCWFCIFVLSFCVGFAFLFFLSVLVFHFCFVFLCCFFYFCFFLLSVLVFHFCFFLLSVLVLQVATNAAESSITLPDCDNVICLGSAKRIEYNERKRRVQLVHRWISRASAVQVIA